MKSDSTDEHIDIANLLLFELIERITRFHLHLEDISERFYPLNNQSSFSSNTKTHLLTPYRECLIKTLQGSLLISKQIHMGVPSLDYLHSLMDELQKLINIISQLHKSELGILPRPPEPPELKRFGRILGEHNVKFGESSSGGGQQETDISIYVDEKISEEVYAGDPLADFKDKIFNRTIKDFNKKLTGLGVTGALTEFENIPENSGHHITIPRIDATNPCRWPTLVHELAHKLQSSNFFKIGTDIEEDFNAFVGDTGEFIPSSLKGKINLKSWLNECWCDLFGVIVMGPSFWFAQTSAFLFCHQTEEFGEITETHPPPIFRLYLINKVLHHRFKEAFFPELEKTLNLSRKLIKYFDSQNKDGFQKNSDLRELALYFKHYFFNHFFTKDGANLILGNEFLNERLASLIRYTKDIKADEIHKMISLLEEGCPIPSVRYTTGEGIQERPSTVQEILVASWMYRNNAFKNRILGEHSTLADNIDSLSGDELWEGFRKTIVKSFKGFNFSVLRSIQVGEWFYLLEGEQDEAYVPVRKGVEGPTEQTGSVLADHEIYDLIKSEDIKIIPLMNFAKQFGSTSLDIRLGTSFQVYHPNQVGIVDLTDQLSVDNANKHSDLIDLDFIDSITISPGQFILAHSMEYIELPVNVSAEVEGRSSFARLGIEVHMTAGFVDPGFQGVLTYEIYNAGPNPIRLYPGLRIGQLRFFTGSAPSKPYNKNPTAKYRGLLTHHNSLQFHDYEVELLSRAVRKRTNAHKESEHDIMKAKD